MWHTLIRSSSRIRKSRRAWLYITLESHLSWKWIAKTSTTRRNLSSYLPNQPKLMGLWVWMRKKRKRGRIVVLENLRSNTKVPAKRWRDELKWWKGCKTSWRSALEESICWYNLILIGLRLTRCLPWSK
jgi:hypothetical protein